MGASSVTGVGLGSAELTCRGPRERNFVGAEKILGPRVVAVGTGAVGTAKILQAVADTTASHYICLANDTTGGNAVQTAIAVDATTGDMTLTFTGTGTDAVVYAVLKTGFAG